MMIPAQSCRENHSLHQLLLTSVGNEMCEAKMDPTTIAIR